MKGTLLGVLPECLILPIRAQTMITVILTLEVRIKAAILQAQALETVATR
jgi:hypothetical protein